ncbi:fructose-specific component phosphotransferase system IIB-like protein [Bradyrhizobium diazoefficiens]
MPVVWNEDPAAIDWNELSALYRTAPLGNKTPADLALVFGNSSSVPSLTTKAGWLVPAERWRTAATAPTSVMSRCARTVRGKASAARSSSGCWRDAADIAKSSSMRCLAKRAFMSVSASAG